MEVIERQSEKDQMKKEKLVKIILPLLIEQLLVVSTGVINTVMVSKAGEAAVSGVALVDMLNFLVITIFIGLSTGGTILCSRFIGENRPNMIPKVFHNLFVIAVGCSFVFMLIGLLGNINLLKLVFGSAEAEVLNNASQYLKLVVMSFPFWGVYSVCAAILKGMGKFKVSMIVAILLNITSIIGSYVLIYHYNLGIMGVAIPTLVSRIIAAVMIFIVLTKVYINYDIRHCIRLLDRKLMKELLNISVPGCIELSIFQMGKIIVLGLVARLGTNAITANAIGNMINNVQALPEDAISIALITLVSKNLGCNNISGAKAYVKKLMKLIYRHMIILNVIIFIFASYITDIFMVSEATRDMTVNIIRFNCIFAVTVWPLAFALPGALKGATDVRYPLMISMSSMWIFRVGLSYLAIYFFHADLYMLYICFAIDWVFRGGMFLKRYLSGKWFKVYKRNTMHSW